MDQLRKNIQKHMEALCLGCGTRHCGSKGEALAAEYIEKTLKDLGVTVISEEYPVRGWEYESFELFNVTQNRVVPGTTACFFSGSADVEGRILFLSKADLSHLEDLPVQGRICMIKHIVGPVRPNNALAEKLEALGAAAVIFITERVAPDTKIVRSPLIERIATGCVDMTGLVDILNHEEDIYHLTVKARPFDTTSRNIIARLGSGEAKGVVGAHYDTAPLTQGANDDASGTSIVLEFVRLLKDVELPITLDLVLFSAEEYCLTAWPVGSRAYVEKHKGEDIRWFMAVDDYGAKVRTEALKLSYFEKLPPLRHNHKVEYTLNGGDNTSFTEEGIPAVWLYDSPTPGIIHTALDNLEFVDYDVIEEGAHKMMDLLQQLIDAHR